MQVEQLFRRLRAKWVWLALAGLIVLGILPIALVQVSGTAGAGLSAGVTQPFGHWWHVALIFLVGYWAGRHEIDMVLLLPLAFLTMLIIGAYSDPYVLRTGTSRGWLFAFIACYAIVFSLGFSRAFVIAGGIASAFAYYAGAYYILFVPDAGTPGFFIFGAVIACGLILAGGMCFALATGGYLLDFLTRVKRVPAVNWLMTLL